MDEIKITLPRTLYEALLNLAEIDQVSVNEIFLHAMQSALVRGTESRSAKSSGSPDSASGDPA